MRHAAHAPASAPVTRHARRWRRMRARLGFAALWAALLVWMLGASLRVPGEDVVSPPEVAARVVAAGHAAQVDPAHVDSMQVAPDQFDLEHVDLERAAAWPAESGALPSHEPALASSHASTPEEDAALYIAGR
jgi:hypothetical protein